MAGSWELGTGVDQCYTHCLSWCRRSITTTTTDVDDSQNGRAVELAAAAGAAGGGFHCAVCLCLAGRPMDWLGACARAARRAGLCAGLPSRCCCCSSFAPRQYIPPTPTTHPPAVQATFGTMFSVLIMVDFMFLDDSAFIYDPDVKVRCSVAAWRLAPRLHPCALIHTHSPPPNLQNWARRTTPQY